MSGQSSGQTPRTSTSSRPSPSSNTRFNRNGDTDIHNSEDLDDGIAAAKQAWDEHSRRRQRPRSSGGFLLQVPPGPDSYPVTYPEQEVSDNVKGKRKLLDGDIIVKKRSSARQQHRQKPSLGSSPLATEISNAQPSEQPPNTINSTNEYAPSHQTSHKSRNATEGLGLSKDGAHPDSGRSAVGFDTDPAQIVNLALSLSESRRRNFSTGSHLVPRDAIEARRLPSTGQPILGLSPGTAGGSLRHHLQQQRQVPRNVSPRSSKSFGGTGAGSPLSQKKMPSRRSSALPDFNMGHIDNASINASDATIARVEKARAALELAYEYRRLLQYLPKLPAPTRSSRGSIKSQTISAEDLGRSYNPLQYIRNRKVRFNEKRPLDAEGQGWNVIENVRPWVDTVVAQGEDGLSRADRKSPLPSVDTFEQTLTVTDGTQATSSQARKVTRPHTVWEFAASDLLADAYWLHQDDNGMHIEDANGNKLVTDHRLPNDDRPRTSKESTRSHLRRSESFMRLNGSPERFRASLENLRSGSKDRGRRRQDTKEPRSPVSDDNGSQTRKSRWPRKFVRSRSPSSSGESRGPKRRGHQRGNDHLGSRDEYDNAALEKHMMEILAREAEDSEAVVEKISAQSKRPENLDHGPNDRSGLNGQIFESENRRPSALQRMRTDMPLSRKHEIVARASLDEQRFAHHRMSSDDFDSTAPNSPTASGFVPSIAINLSPPSSPPTATSSPRKPVPSRLSTFRRTHSPSVHKRVLSENDIEPDAGTLADISRQTTNESQPVNLIRKDRSLPTSNGFLSPTKTDPLRGSIRSTKEGNVPDSRFRSLFKGGRIAELVGSGVSRVGDLFWKKDSSSHPSETNSPAPSNFASEESNPDDGDDGLLNSSPDNDHSQKKTNTEDMSSLSRASPKSEQPKYHMSNLPSFQSSINRDRGLPNAAKATSGYDHITRQQLALRERGRSSRFDRLAPPKIDMRNISPSPSPSPSPDHAVGRVTSKGESRHSSSSRSSRRVRSADKRLNDALKIPGKVATGYLAPTGLSRLAVHQQESRARPTPGDKRQWSISDRGLSAVRGTITKRDIARVRALLLSSGVKASEIVRRAEEIPANPSPLLQGLEDVFNGNLPHLPRSQEYIVAGRTLVSNIETTTQNLRDTADEFSHVTVDKLHHQIKDIDDRVNFELTPLVRAAADDADAFSTELTTTHTLAVKQLNDSVDLILRRRRRRLRWVRRWGWAMLEWTLLGVMWMRGYASNPQDSNTKPSIYDSDTIVLPGTQSRTAANAQPPPPGPVLSASPTAHGPKPSTETVIPPQQIPLTPPTPPGGKVQTAPPTSIPPASDGAKTISPTIPKSDEPTTSSAPPPSSPPPPPKRKSRRFRRSLQALFILTILGYAGGTYYSLVSDNFHDFFTEYVPFGEDCVFYFEDREFRKRFPNAMNPSNRSSPDAGGNKVTIPSRGGVSWKIAGHEHQGSDLQTKGRHMSALDANKPAAQIEAVQQNPSVADKPQEKTKAVEKAKEKATPSPVPETKPVETEPKGTTPPQNSTEPEKPAPKAEKRSTSNSKKKPKEASPRLPEVNEPSIARPLQRIDPLKSQYSEEPLVQDLVKLVNDIITVVNDDGAAHKYTSTINKAKAELAGVGQRISSLKDAEKKAAEEKIKSTQVEFDNAAKELVRRLEEEMRAEQGKWRDEFESEREKISQSYQERLKTEIQRAREVSEQTRRNELLEQAVALKKQFLSEVTDRVETERNGRLSKLSELSSSVSELEKLTADWNSVIDANLKTQHLTVAVEAVRSSLETADRPRPFIKELAALKEIASDDSVVNAAIASINPTAYQRGVPTSAQLIDRFRRVAAEVRKASLLPEDAGVASHAASFVLSKFMFKKRGMTVGDDVESVLTRTETLLEEGNLDDAAREMNTLEGWAKTLSWDWLSECRRVLEVRQAMDVIATEARLEGLKVD